MVNSSVKNRKLVIFGTEDFADIAYEYFTCDSCYEVVAFTVDRAYLQEESRFDLPVVAFDDLKKRFPPEDHHFFAAIVYSDLNRLRQTICCRARNIGYGLAKYISSRAFVSPSATVGEHCFIFENNSIQPYVRIGNNVVLWCNNQIGHHSRIGDHCFLSGSVAMGGWVTIEEHCFVGLNTALANNTAVGRGSWISHGASLSGNIPSSSFVLARNSCFLPLDEPRLFSALRRMSRTRKLHGTTDSASVDTTTP